VFDQLDPLVTGGGEIVRTGGLVGGVRVGDVGGGDVVGDAVPVVADPPTGGVVVGAEPGVELCPVPEVGVVAELGAVAVVADVLEW
jgi:hypothetical protein